MNRGKENLLSRKNIVSTAQTVLNYLLSLPGHTREQYLVEKKMNKNETVLRKATIVAFFYEIEKLEQLLFRYKQAEQKTQSCGCAQCLRTYKTLHIKLSKAIEVSTATNLREQEMQRVLIEIEQAIELAEKRIAQRKLHNFKLSPEAKANLEAWDKRMIVLKKLLTKARNDMDDDSKRRLLNEYAIEVAPNEPMHLTSEEKQLIIKLHAEAQARANKK